MSDAMEIASPVLTESDAVQRLRLMQGAEPPMCCGRPMEMRFLNFGDIKDLSNFSENEYADYLSANVPFPPCWNCDVCEKELLIDGLDWPEADTKEKPKDTEVEKITPNFCPHCGKKLA